jgi:hypothetical protein
MRPARCLSARGFAVLLVVSLGAIAPAAGGQSQKASNGTGRCEGNGPDSAALANVVLKPDSKPRRIDMDLTIGQGAFRLATSDDQFKNYGGHMRRVGVRALIDTAGHVIPGSGEITSSSSGQLSNAVCDAMAAMRFRPAKKSGSVVVAQYADNLEFIGTSATSTERGPQSQSSVR